MRQGERDAGRYPGTERAWVQKFEALHFIINITNYNCGG